MCNINEPSAASFATETVAPSLIVRSASIMDLDAMLDIGLSAMPMDPQWNWRFPYRLQFPGDTRHFTCRKYREFLEDKTGRWQVIVAETKPENDDASITVAMAIWDVGGINRCSSHKRRKSRSGARTNSSTNPDRRDGDPKRMQAWTSVTAKSKEEIFDREFGHGQLHLQILATHPEYQRRGAGRLLCEWGFRLAERASIPITVFASPMGIMLYQRTGFVPVDDVRIRTMEDDDDGVVLVAMTFVPQSFANAMKWRQVVWDQSSTSEEEADWKRR